MHQRLANALSYNEFRIFYQPVVTVRDGEIVGVEALCRWPQRDQTFAMPETFIAHAEPSGFIIQLGDWVLRTAAEQVRRWQQLFKKRLRLAVNLSGRQFLHFNLIKGVEDALRNANFDPSDLDFEITETIAMHNAEESVGVMRQLKSLGIGLSLDDFGTGYSSLSYLKRFPIDTLKIDRSFMPQPGDNDSGTIAAAVISMAHSLGYEVIAEGVESEEQAAFLRSHRCDYMQGFLHSRPAPPNEITALLRAGG